MVECKHFFITIAAYILKVLCAFLIFFVLFKSSACRECCFTFTGCKCDWGCESKSQCSPEWWSWKLWLEHWLHLPSVGKWSYCCTASSTLYGQLNEVSSCKFNMRPSEEPGISFLIFLATGTFHHSTRSRGVCSQYLFCLTISLLEHLTFFTSTNFLSTCFVIQLSWSKWHFMMNGWL